MAISAVLAALSLAGLAWYGQSARLEARSGLDERIAQHQRYVQHALAMALRSGDIARVNAELDALQDQPDLARMWLEPKGMAPALARERTGAVAVGEQVSRRQTLSLGGDVLGEVRVDYSTARADQLVQSTLRTLFAFAVALVLAAGATALVVARGIARPIAQWTRAATALAEGADGPAVSPHGPPELVALGASVERMCRFKRDRVAAAARQDQQINGVIAEREQIQAERDRLIGLIESTTDLVGTSDADLNVTYLNRAGRHMTWVGDRQADTILIASLHPEWAGRLIKEQGLPTALRAGTWSGETAVLDAQGREVPVSQVITCHRDAAGQVIYLSTIMRDITDRKHAEAALKRSEARLRQALQASGTGVFEHDHDTDTLYWSPESRQIFGFDNDQPIAFADLVASVHPEDRQGFVLAAQHAHDPSGDGSFDIVFRHIRPEGGVRWASCRSLTAFEGEGSTRRSLRTTGAMVDITERREAQAALERSEERLRQAVRLTRSGILDHDHRTDTIYWSNELRAIYGFSADEPVTLPAILACVHPQDFAVIGPSLERAHDPKGDGQFDVVHRIVRRDGAIRWLETRSITLFDGTGDARRPARTAGAVIDVTERMLANEALRRSESRLTYAVRASNTGIYDHDLASEVMYVSPELRAIFGWPADAPVTVAYIVASVLEEDRDRLGAAIARTHDPAGDGLYEIEYRIRRGDGALRWVNACGQTLFAGDGAERRPVRTVGGAVDITERRDAEEALRRSEGRLTHALRASNTGVYDHDHASDVIYWSPELRAMCGWTADEPVTIAKIVETNVAEDRDRMAAEIAHTHDPAGDGLFDIEYRVRCRNGAVRWLRSCGQTLFAGIGADRHPVRTVGGVIDITERREGEEALRRSERRLTQAVQASSTGIFEHDHVSGAVYCSPEHRIMNGWSADQPISVADIVAATLAEDRDRLGAAMMRSHDPAGNGALDAEHRIRRRDGVVRWLSVRAQTYFAGEGAERHPVRTVGGVIDITERREAEEALRLSEGRLARVVQASNTGIFDHDHVSGAIYWSPEYRAIHGRSADEPITIASVGEATLAEDRDRFAAAIQRTHDPAGDGRYEIEFRIRRRDGTLRCLRSSAQTLFAGVGAERHPVRTVGGVVDITERREAEEALRRSELNYRTLFETMRQGVVTQDRSGAIIDANPAAQEILGLSLEQMQGRTSMDPHWRTVLPDGRDFPGNEHPAMVSLRTNRPVRDVTMGVVRPDEPEHRWILVSAIPRVRSGDAEPCEVTATFTDITEIKRAGEQIQRLNAELEQRVRDRTAQLEATVRELESFSYSVSHDLRAPLRGIDGFSQALLEDCYDRLDDTGRDYLQRVRANTQRMGHLIDDLLKLSRVTRAPLTPNLVDLSKLAQHVLHQLQDEQPGHHPLTTVQPGASAQGDPGLLLVALENLLGNAWKYSARRPDACIEFGHTPRDGETIYFVRDNGVGFDMKYVSKLFGAFQRLHHQKDFEGTGIGLATVDRIISRHGGRVWAEAEVGKGATFYFTIGLLAEASSAKPAGVNRRVNS